MPSALEYHAWVVLAEEKGLFISIDDVANYPFGTPVSLTPVEYTKFKMIAYPIKYPSSEIPLPAAVFFAPFERTIARSSDLQNEFMWYRDYASPGGCVQVFMPAVFTSMSYKNEAPGQHDTMLHSPKADRLAVSGSGDGYTRYILTSSLTSMPPLFYKKE